MKNIILNSLFLYLLGFVLFSVFQIDTSLAIAFTALQFIPIKSGVLAANAWSDTVLPDAMVMLAKNLQSKFESRKPLLNAIQIALKARNSSYIPELNSIQNAAFRTSKIRYNKKKAFTVTTDKACDLTGEQTGSGTATPTWLRSVVTLDMGQKVFEGNYESFVEAMAHNMSEAQFSLFEDIEKNIVAFLNTNRTQVNAISTTGVGHNTWKATPDFFVEVAKSDVGRFYNYLLAEMAANNYTGMFDELHNNLWTADRSYYYAQGAGNATNTAFQFAPNWNHYPSNYLTPDAYYMSKHFIIPEGGIALIDWAEKLNVQGKVSADKQWGMLAPAATMLPIKVQTFITEECGDTTNDGGAPQDLITKIEMACDYAIVIPPQSTANETSIFKYAILNS